MKKTILKLGLGALLAANSLILGEAVLPFSDGLKAAGSAEVATPADTKIIQGKIANISQKAQTVALSTKDGDFFLMKFTDTTVFKGGSGPADFKEDEAVIAQYTTLNNENIATSLEKDIVKLPEGIQEITTEELAKRLAQDNNMVIIDSRPAVKFDEGHIPGAVSIPLAKLMAVGDEGAKLLAPYQDRQLVFYCGGTT